MQLWWAEEAYLKKKKQKKKKLTNPCKFLNINADTS